MRILKFKMKYLGGHVWESVCSISDGRSGVILTNYLPDHQRLQLALEHAPEVFRFHGPD